jgi:2'-5' RNA ligase
MRLFVAAEIDAATREKICATQARVREACVGWKASWTGRDAFHLTLKFLGEVDEARVEGIAAALALAGEGHAPIAATFATVGAFPPRGVARIVWLGVEAGAAALIELAADVDRRLAALDFPSETRAFHPHLTLARVRQPGGRLPVMVVETIAADLQAICLYRSQLGGRPAKYSVITRVPLALSDEKRRERH